MRFKKRIRIADFEVSADSPVFFIAEAGVNHCGQLRLAKRLVDVAVAAGADAVKFQAFRTKDLILKGVGKAPYQRRAASADESQFDMLKGLELTEEELTQIAGYCRRKGIIFIATAFDEYSLDFVARLNPAAYKIASTDLTNLPFIRKAAKKGKPVIVSSGMSYLSEVKLALKEIYPFNRDVILLQCTADYPTKDRQANLRVIADFAGRFNIIAGYSDHTSGIGAAPYAVAAGAKVIEKHFTLDKSLKGPDHKASLDPGELRECIRRIRAAERYMGMAVKKPTPSEKRTRLSLQKRFVAARKIKKGERFGAWNIVAKRTGGKGISPVKYREVFGRQAKRDFEPDEVITL